MNGAHDTGGQMSFGPVIAERNEPVFHADWEARVFAVSCAYGEWTIDENRHACEKRPPQEYARLSYYDIWLEGLSHLLIAKGLVTVEELRTGTAETATPLRDAALRKEDVAAYIAASGSYRRTEPAAQRFRPGDRVRARNLHPGGHTRLPRYLRGHAGEIVAVHGAHVFPDSHAHGKGEDPQWLYTVRFTAKELWNHDGSDSVSADLWEPYLESV